MPAGADAGAATVPSPLRRCSRLAGIGHVGGVDQPQQRHLRRLARVGRDLDVLQAFEQHLPQAVDRAPAERSGHFFGSVTLLGGLERAGRGARLGPRRRVQRFHEAAEQLHRVDAELVRFVELGERGGGIAREHQLQQAPDAAAVGEPEHVAHLIGGDGAGTVGDRLVEDRQAVAGGAFGGARDHAERFGLDLDAFGLRDFGEMGGELLGGNAAEVEALAAREHRHRHLVHFGGREEELHMLRRFLKSLQQRIESALRKHVNFVDDVDLVARADRGVADRVDDLADVVDAGVRGGVHLDHVDVPAFGDGAALARRRCTA